MTLILLWIYISLPHKNKQYTRQQGGLLKQVKKLLFIFHILNKWELTIISQNTKEKLDGRFTSVCSCCSCMQWQPKKFQSGKKEEKTRLLDEITTTQSFKLSIGETVVMEKHFHSYLKNYVWNITPSSNFDFIWFDGWCFNNWWMSVEMCYQSRDKNFKCSNYIPLKCWRVVTLLFSFL